MTSSHPLSPGLLEVLVRFTSTFAHTAANFRALLSDADEFTRICELHNTLDILTASESPTRQLWELRGRHSDGSGVSTKQDAEELLALMLNSEFVLFSMYSEYDIALNPSLSHWVSLCRRFDEMMKAASAGAGGEGRGVGGGGGWTLRQRVLKIRAAFVKGILGGQGNMLASMSPEHFAMNGMDFEIDVDRFREALRSQGIYDHDPLFSGTPVPSAASSYAPPATPQSAAPPSSESGSPPSPDPSLANQITSAILHATSSELPAALTSKVLSHLSSSPQLVTLLPSDLLSTSTLPALVDTNPQLARGLVLLTLAHGSKVQRKEVVSAFSYVPITLPALEIVNDVVLSKTPLLTYDEVCILVHEVLENGIRSAEAMGGLGAAVRGLDSNGMSPGGGASGMAATRQAQSRHVKLLCLFIQSLLRNDVVDLQQLYYQIQDIGVKFMFVKEARELWRAYCANVDS